MKRRRKRPSAGKGAGAAAAAQGRRPGGPPGRQRPVLLLLLLAAVVTGAVLYLARQPILAAFGRMLIASDPLEPADAAVVLAGDDSYEGTRVRTAVQLYRQGWVRKVVLSGAKRVYGDHETDLSVPLAVSLGVPPSDILPVPSDSRSTQQEAELIAPMLERRGIRSLYVVSTAFHTRRGKRLFIRASGGRLRVLARPAPDPWFDPEHWWQTRPGRVFFISEWLKHLHSLVE